MKYLDLKLLLFIVVIVLGTKSNSQEFLNPDNFNNKTIKNIVAVEFWVSWNSSKYPELQKEYDVTCIPTVIIFENGEEKERFKANIMFELESNKKEIQGTIDDIMLAKFK